MQRPMQPAPGPGRPVAVRPLPLQPSASSGALGSSGSAASAMAPLPLPSAVRRQQSSNAPSSPSSPPSMPATATPSAPLVQPFSPSGPASPSSRPAISNAARPAAALPEPPPPLSSSSSPSAEPTAPPSVSPEPGSPKLASSASASSVLSPRAGGGSGIVRRPPHVKSPRAPLPPIPGAPSSASNASPSASARAASPPESASEPKLSPASEDTRDPTENSKTVSEGRNEPNPNADEERKGKLEDKEASTDTDTLTSSSPILTSSSEIQQQHLPALEDQVWPSTGSRRHIPLHNDVDQSAHPSSSPTTATPTPTADGPTATPAHRDAAMLKVIMRDDCRTMMALLNALEFSDMDKITRATVEYFVALESDDAAHPLLFNLLKVLLLSEITRTEDPTTLFRSNTNGSKMLSSCLRICGNAYLESTVGPVISRVCRETPQVEIDPERATSLDDAHNNIANLQALCEEFLYVIFTSTDSCPIFLRRIFAFLQESVTARFPDNKQIAVNHSIIGGFIFLRFFCSAIFSPFGFGVIGEQPKPEAMRAFVLVSKVLQMLANGLTFSDKTSEEYMRDMNPLLDRHHDEVIDFFRSIATVPEEEVQVIAVDVDKVAQSLESTERPASSVGAGDTLLGAFHKYSHAITSALDVKDPSGAASQALAEFLATFPPPVPVPVKADGASAPSAAPAEKKEPDNHPIVPKKKGGLGFAAAGKRATTLMSTLRGLDKDKHKEKEKELDKEKDDHHTPQTEAPTLLSARRKEEGGTLHDLKAILVQLRGIKQTVETEIANVEQQLLDVISGQTPAENVRLSPSTLALLAALKPPETEAQRKERRKMEKEKEKRELEEREQKERERKEKERREKEEKRKREKEEKKEERRSRRLSMDSQSSSKLWRRTANSNLNPDEAKEFAKFSEMFGSALKSTSGRASAGASGSNRSSRSGSGSEIVRENRSTDSPSSSPSPMSSSMDELAGGPDPIKASETMYGTTPEAQRTEEAAISFYASSTTSAEKRILGHRQSAAVAAPLSLSGTVPVNDSADGIQALAEQAAHPSSGLVKDRKQKLRTHKNCFVGCELVDWFLAQRRAATRNEAVALGQQLLSHKLIVPVQTGDVFEDKKTLYRFVVGGESGLSSVTTVPNNLFPDDEEDEELDKLYPYMVSEIEIKNRKDHENKTHKNCFVASQAIAWLTKNRYQPMTNDQALEFAEKLRQKGYIKWVGRKTRKISVSGPIIAGQASGLASGPVFEDDDSYYVFERKNKYRFSKHVKPK